ncbi:MAG: ABC transporter substrate-binding protein [Oscillospiraceae bacterium]|nr:ABC transporter substrate-binding protein [Oscillospiraceae bacterium]
MKKRLIALCCAATMLLSLAACGSKTSETTSTPDEQDETVVYKVGICQLVTHDALDAATQGFQDALNELLPGQVEFDYQNAAGDSNTCATIANGFVSDGVDLIMANATPALQAAATATSDIPVLGTSITEYGVALGIENFNGTVGSNVSGTSDLAPLDQQAAMIQEWYPDAQTVGLLYCANEANSQYQVDTVQAYLEEMGYTCTQYPFSDSNDIASVCQTAADASDVLYVPTDNTCASNTGIIDNICRGNVPVFCGEEGICAGCGMATLSISYYDIGYKTGEMAAQILTGESDVAEMAIEYAPEFVKKYNPTICADLGVTAPEGYEAIA